MKKIAITGGAGQIAYNLLFRVASGEMLGPEEPIELRILEIPEAKQALEGVLMELEDCAFPLLEKVYASSDPFEIFENVDLAILIGASPRGPGMERKDLLFQNAKIFIEQGKAINEKASKDVLVFVVGNPCNTNALITRHHAPRIDSKQFFSMTRLDENRAKAQLAKHANIPVQLVKNITIWGNHSSTQVPDFFHGKIKNQAVLEIIEDRTWLEKEFVGRVQKRGAEVIQTRGKSSAASAANAIIDSIHSLIKPTPEGEWFSVGVCSDNNPYQIQGNLIFSFPCISKGKGNVEIVPNLEWSPFLKEKIAITENELIEERETIKDLL